MMKELEMRELAMRETEECYFCSPNRQTHYKVTDNVWEIYYLDENYDLNAIADDPYCGTGPMEINFCPICGRKLH